MVVDILDTLDEGTCKNCGGRIVKLAGGFTAAHWTHEIDHRFQTHCPGSKMAEPVEKAPEREPFRGVGISKDCGFHCGEDLPGVTLHCYLDCCHGAIR